VVAAGEVTFEVRNDGEDPHNLVLSPAGSREALAAFSDVAAGGLAKQKVSLRGGAYRLWCSVEFHEDAGMYATLRVE